MKGKREEEELEIGKRMEKKGKKEEEGLKVEMEDIIRSSRDRKIMKRKRE